MYAQQGAGGVIAVRLTVGTDIHGGLLDACARFGVDAAFVVSGIGMLAEPRLGWYDVESRQYHEQLFPGRHELLGLSGNISVKDGGPFAHLHAVLSDEEQRCFGGHLFGASVGLTLEACILPAGAGVRMHRRIEQEFGLPGLIIESD